MIVLTPDDKLQIVLGAETETNELECVASWRDITETPTYVAGRSVADTNGITDVDFVTSPAALTRRLIDFLSVYNTDTEPATVIIKYDASGTDRVLYRGNLQPGEMATYHNEKGWSKLNANGDATKAVTVNKEQIQLAAGISYGTDAPMGGEDGDIYFQIEE